MINYTATRTKTGAHSDRDLYLYDISFHKGIRVKLTNAGASLMSIYAADKDNQLTDVICGFENPGQYLGSHPYFGSTCGRYANRIKEGRFTLEGIDYQLPVNNVPNHLHGGDHGFHQVVWEEAAFHTSNEDECVIVFRYLSKDGDSGYPGTVAVTVEYLIEKAQITIRYGAVTDQTTIINLTNHSYFNLSGDFKTSITDHELKLNSNYFLPVDKHSIPTGELKEVQETPFDFRELSQIGQHLAGSHKQLVYGQGIDHCFSLEKPDANSLQEAGYLLHRASGRIMSVITSEPGIQLYTGNHLDGLPGKNGDVYGARSALCLETQHFPDSPNQKNFPSTVLKVGQKYSTQTTYRFSVI